MTADELPAAFATLPPAWRVVLPGWTPAAEAAVCERVRAVSGTREIGPPDPFRALRVVAPEAARVVILGQDPYPRPGHADGMAFSAGQGKPHSLRRIFDVLGADRPAWQRPGDWCLDPWAEQGVLLLNPVLTVELGSAGSHMSCGWQALTSEIVSVLCRRAEPPAFLLWGKPANAFFDAACPAGCTPPVWRTRHPSHDFKREFMADGSHFAATADRVDWWGGAGISR
ncbi:uracil-DNA glycosylase [Rubrivivax gelatinosus]|uniref:Uracil-DNA glycosylase n=1 Tax=Rubrivivax gelatinosus TaxID=28068 RepID=A0A4R2LX18_RUBGE|nr:uracil-DNA glycosylase [Rubrivivax gelatinosus]MBK1686285.1 uracil-DNA glycosylase [Rubrivivax gelatinosus]TCO96874.1 uracil-DNA glycosylase [Rubrivivax gelatinosus]